MAESHGSIASEGCETLELIRAFILALSLATGCQQPAVIEQSPAAVLYFETPGKISEAFSQRLDAFANMNGYELQESKQTWELGWTYRFMLESNDVSISGGNRIIDYQIDPNAHTGAPPPRYDPTSYEVQFYINSPTVSQKDVDRARAAIVETLSQEDKLAFRDGPKLYPLPPDFGNAH